MLRISLAFALFLGFASFAEEEFHPTQWPEITNEQKPWTYWWWMGSAVDKENLTALLEQYQAAGLGGVHVIPIYGVKGEEENFLPFLSDAWVEMVAHATAECARLGLGLDMSTGTGWPFGGPMIPEDLAAQQVVFDRSDAHGGTPVEIRMPQALQAVMAYGPDGAALDLMGSVVDGTLKWTPPEGDWKIYAVAMQPTGQQVKRAAPGGEGNVLDPFSTDAMTHYTGVFTEALAKIDGPKPRAQYHDSYEYYKANWTPDFFEKFQARRGYDLRQHLPALLGEGHANEVARVKGDYRQTLDDLHEETMRAWADWARGLGYLTRNEAHGAPGNLLDLYALADMPETETFGPSGFPIPGLRNDENAKDKPDPLILKLSSSAAHTAGRRRTSSESATWLGEHFQVALSQVKPELDQLFVSGINHIFYHGIAYSPVDAEWPGWLFYASTNFAPSNSFWPHFDALNAYAARCQAILQAGRPANDILLYFPIQDIYNTADGETLQKQFTVHGTAWMNEGGLREVAQQLWDRGYTFDYVSDALLMNAEVKDGAIHLGDGVYQTVLLPPCRYLPTETLQQLLTLTEAGANVIALGGLDKRVPGWHEHEARQVDFDALRDKATAVRVGEDVEALLGEVGVKREEMVDHGLEFIRRKIGEDYFYFITNLSAEAVSNQVKLGVAFQQVAVADPLNVQVPGLAHSDSSIASVNLHLRPGRSIVLRTLSNGDQKYAFAQCEWREVDVRSLSPLILTSRSFYTFTDEGSVEDILEFDGPWHIAFLSGGPEPPAPIMTEELKSWTEYEGSDLKSFSGLARYSNTFTSGEYWRRPSSWRNGSTRDVLPQYQRQLLLDLGDVRESARVSLNGSEVATAFSHPFIIDLTEHVRPGKNTLEIEVVNLPANRIAALDRSGADWRRFHDINFVNIQYKPFDASGWTPYPSGLLETPRLLLTKDLMDGKLDDPQYVFKGETVKSNFDDSGSDAGLPLNPPELAEGWQSTVMAELDQSYAGWDVEIGDADNDGLNEVLVSGCPDSRLYFISERHGSWVTSLMANNLAHRKPGMGLSVRVVDLNNDGANEVILGTGQEGHEAGPAYFYVMGFSVDSWKASFPDGSVASGLDFGSRALTHQVSTQAFMKDSLYTHNFGVYDIDGDGLQEVISAYCGTGEITRYDVSADLQTIERRQLYTNEGSG
ncbi:MAG: hypothetical protein IT368_16500, partial [Candidatus Hydrogenedentes bacterium]|nr:hypothetical protein [Candidatus Hydrogenedentota bacterium]